MQKFVIRLLGQSDELLGWTQELVQPSAGGAFRVSRSSIPVARDGVATRISIHWTDLDIARVEDLFGGAVEVASGQLAAFTWMKPIWEVHGELDVPLPPVTVSQSVSIGVPCGVLGVVG